MARKNQSRTRVYSYIRFSSDEQREGDSIRRQREWRDQFLSRNPDLELDDSLMLLDEGRSAYKGDHRNKGALGVFLKHVEQGRIPHGSILLVESVDRLTRLEPFDALEMVLVGLFKHGIDIQTQLARYDRDAVNNGQIHGLFSEIQRAYMESKHKSERVRAARTRSFEKAREDGAIVTSQCPAWLRVEDGRFEVIPAAVATIKLIFDWKLEGLSQRRIEARLNDEAPWTPPPVAKNPNASKRRGGNGWRCSYIKKILNNRAVIGEYQPHRRINGGPRLPDGPPIEDYYPAIIEKEVFFAVQRQLDANRGKGGRADKKRNIFTHLVKCAYCGGSMRYTDKGQPQWRYLVCDNAARGVSCDCHNVRYAEVQELVLESCRHLRPEQVLPSTDEQTATVNSLRQRIGAGEAELRDIEEQIENFLDQVGRTKQPKIREGYEARIARLHERAEALNATVATDQRELANAETGTKRFKTWKRGVAELMGAIADDEAADIRARLAAHLREFIDCIEIFPVGFKVVADPSKHLVAERGEVVEGRNGRHRRRPAKRGWLPHVETILELLPDDVQPKRRKKQFHRYVLDRRMSKEGRFYRIRFTNGERIDVVPPEGLATGMIVLRQSVERREPDVGSLWTEFVEKHGN